MPVTSPAASWATIWYRAKSASAQGFVHYDDYQRSVAQLAMSCLAQHLVRSLAEAATLDHVVRPREPAEADEVNAEVARWIRSRGDVRTSRSSTTSTRTSS